MPPPSEQAGQFSERPQRGPESRKQPIQLKHASDDRVVVTPEDLDKFVLTSAEAVKACTTHEIYKSVEQQLRDRFTKLVTKLLEWCDERDEVAAAAIMHDDDGFVCEIATVDAERNVDLDDEIYDLEMTLASEFSEFPFVVRSLPYVEAPIWSSDRCARESVVEIYAKSA